MINSFFLLKFSGDADGRVPVIGSRYCIASQDSMYFLVPQTTSIRSGKITRLDRLRAWNELQTAGKEKKTRPFYRAVNKHGFMYAGHWHFYPVTFRAGTFGATTSRSVAILVPIETQF
ncbi:hypothetical protein RD792_011513 [Penstemon davidsonii]|uniref:Uncharacterized protein n=1 Tax=Penstemon davidsonii TaxID=160366 RepID=A0ABR0D5J7_9LAMI|nr:hypothetical protein RD792_011513 [Penstemon davidsonii]